jgi:site-specific recombinase XerD
MTRSTFRVLFFLKRDKEKANGSVPLFCRITVDGQEVRFGMKRDINPKYWDVKSGKATGRSDEAAAINSLMDNTKSAIIKVYRELQERDNCVTAEKVKNIFLGNSSGQKMLLSFFDEINLKKKALVGKTISSLTYDRHCTVRRHVTEFLEKDCKLSDIALKDIDHKFLCDFESFMLVTRGCNENSSAKYMHIFKHIVVTAIKFGWIYKNPFADYQIRRIKGDRAYLTQEEVEILMKQDFKSKSLERVRDVFVFCCFTGLSYIDVKALTHENIRILLDGKPWITGKRGKTSVSYQVPLLETPQRIIEKHKGKISDDRLLPVSGNRKTNLNLRQICKQCGITKKVTFHVSRHTFATFALSMGVSIESVSKMLGHTNIQTTQIYARITDKKVGNEMNMFAGRIKSLYPNLHLATADEVKIEEILKSLKIRTGKTSGEVWETLAAKVWCRMTNVERQSFKSEMENRENKPKTVNDFYVALMDYFLENMTGQDSSETAPGNVETKQAVNF